MSQTSVDFSDDPSGVQLLDNKLTPLKENILTQNSGTSRPSYAQAGTQWLDTTTTPWVLKRFDGTDDIIEGYINATTNQYTPAGGLLNNLSASTNPTINEDSGDGYAVGSIWINTSTDKIFQCADSTLGAAVWVFIAQALTTAADKIQYYTGSNVAALTDFTSQARQLCDDTSFSAMRATLGAEATVSSLSTVTIASDDYVAISDTSDSGNSKKALVSDISGSVTGAVSPYSGRTAPSGWLFCDGSAVSRTTYAALFAIICPSLGNFTVTIASPAVFTLTAHGLQVGEKIRFTTSGALPTGLTANTDYFVSAIPTADTFRVSATLGGADVNTSGSQSGTHTAQFFGYGAGDGSTTFNVPDIRGRVIAGRDAMGGTSANRLTGVTGSVNGDTLGGSGGAETHTLITAEIPAHVHSETAATTGGGEGGYGGVGTKLTVDSGSAGGGGAHNNVQPTFILNYIIKT